MAIVLVICLIIVEKSAHVLITQLQKINAVLLGLTIKVEEHQKSV